MAHPIWTRRDFVRSSAALALLPATARSAFAQSYAQRPIRIIAGYPAGNAPDLVARLIGQWLSGPLGQSVIVENRPGAGSNIGTEAVVRSAPDGHTLLMSVLTNVFNTSLYTGLSFNFINDMTQIAGVANAPYVLIVTPDFPAKTVAEFVAYAKANPGKINFASSGKGSSTHIFTELFKTMAGIDVVHVPYRSSYMPDLLSGQIHFAINPIPQALELVRNGKVRALGVTTEKRLASLPDVPPVTETVQGYVATGWYGLSAPKGTPPAIIEQINAATNKALTDPALIERLATLGVEPMAMSPAQFAGLIDRESQKWTKVIRDAQVVLE